MSTPVTGAASTDRSVSKLRGLGSTIVKPFNAIGDRAAEFGIDVQDIFKSGNRSNAALSLGERTVNAGIGAAAGTSVGSGFSKIVNKISPGKISEELAKKIKIGFGAAGGVAGLLRRNRMWW